MTFCPAAFTIRKDIVCRTIESKFHQRAHPIAQVKGWRKCESVSLVRETAAESYSSLIIKEIVPCGKSQPMFKFKMAHHHETRPSVCAVCCLLNAVVEFAA